MDYLSSHILSLIIFLPLAGVAVIALIPRAQEERARAVALIVAGINFIVSLYLWFDFQTDTAAFQFVEDWLWIPLGTGGRSGIRYHLGLDGISLLLVLLTTFLTPICILAAWTDVKKRVREFVATLLMLETGMIGVFVSLDLILFYVFWEAMLIPMYLLIGIWGGPRRIYAAVKFVLFTMVGSVLMLIAIIALYFIAGQNTFDFVEIETLLRNGDVSLPVRTQMLMFGAFGLAFAIKVPMFPFHTWLPDAHTEAPTSGSVILAGVLLKMGTYGFLRFCLPLFPQAALRYLPWIAILSLIGVVYGALVALAQFDVKKLVAYSSVSHLGIVMLGMFTFNLIGLTGSMLQMINHGLSTGALFLLVGMIYERRHTRQISDFGGIALRMPVYASIFTIVTMSSIGLPALNGFVGEILVLVGMASSDYLNPAATAGAALGMILGAIYMLRVVRSVFYGPLELEENKQLKDLNVRELCVITPLLIFILWLGVYPKPFKDRMQASLEQVRSVVATHNPPSESELHAALPSNQKSKVKNQKSK